MSKDKKLKDFNDSKGPLSKRFKSLITFTESATDEELGPFFQKDAYNIWAVFLDTFQAYEQQKTPRKFEEIERLLSIMRKIFVFLPNKIKEKWQIRSIAGILEKTLDRNNRYEVRELGLELLIMFLVALDAPETPQASAFGSVADLSAFLPLFPNSKIILPNKIPSVADRANLLLPSLQPPTVEETVRILEHFLNHITADIRIFPLGWSLFKRFYMVYFYPEISKEVGLLDKHSSQDYGFPYCPYEIQKLLIPKLTVWSNNPEILKILWATPVDVALLMEIYKQTTSLPPEMAEITRNSVQVFHHLLLEPDQQGPSHVIQSNPAFVNFQKFFLECLPQLFITEGRTSVTEARTSLCIEVLDLFKRAFSPQVVSNEIRDVLLFTLLEITGMLLKRDNPNQDLANSLAKEVIETVFYTWISSKCVDGEMWVRLQEGLGPIFHRAETVSQLKLILIHISMILCKFVYPTPPEKEKVKMEGASNKKNKDAPSLTPDDVQWIKLPGNNPFEALDWTYDYARFVWKSILQSFSSTNRLKEYTTHASSLSAIIEVIELFLVAEARAPYAFVIKQTEEGGASSIPIQLLNTFGPLLFEACYIADDKFIKSKILAVEGLARLICRFNRIIEVPPSVLPHFYNVIHHLLANPIMENNGLSETIVDCTSNIFNLGLPGSTLLLPYYLKEIKRLLKTEKTPLKIRRKCVILLASMISIVSQFSDVEIKMKYIGHQHKQLTKENFGFEEKVTCAELRDHITGILIAEIGFGPLEMKCMCIWSIYLVIMDSLFYSPDVAKIRELIGVIVQNTAVSIGSEINDHLLGITSLDALVGLAQVLKELKQVDSSFPYMIVNGIAHNLMKEMTAGGLNRMEHLLCAHFDAIAEWLLMEPSLLEHPDLLRHISLSISYGIHAKKLDFKKKNKIPKEKTTDEPPKANIRYTAMGLFYQLLHSHRNYPSLPGCEVSPNTTLESDDGGNINDDVDYFIYNGEVVLSVVDVTDPLDPKAPVARIFARTAAGRFAWNFKCVEDPTSNFSPLDLQPPENNVTPISGVSETPLIRKSDIPGVKVPELPVHRPDDVQKVDKVDELLLHLGDKYPELIPVGNITLLRPTLLPNQYLMSISTMQDAYIDQQKNDVEHNAQRNDRVKEDINKTEDDEGMRLLYQMGFLGDRMDNVKLVDQNKNFLLKLRNLDKAFNRDVIKVGLLYVREGQETQQEILENSTASDIYREFVSGMSWPIDLSVHKGYMAGLDSNGSNGKTSSYFSGPMLELMFHEIVRMPTTDDKQQLLKKRHVGNDAVHVIWNENGRDYSPKTIVSQFNQAHIILSPLRNGMVRVIIAKKDDEVPLFGPLLHGMIVPKKLVPILARQTAINAHRYYYMDKHDSCFATRHRSLADTISKCVTKKTWEDQMVGVMLPGQVNIRDSVMINPPAVSAVVNLAPPALIAVPGRSSKELH